MVKGTLSIPKVLSSIATIFIALFMLCIACQPALSATGNSGTNQASAATLSPGLSPGILPVATVDPSVINKALNSYHTSSPLLYVVSNNTISVIEVNTNKVVDIIYFKPEIVPEGVAVNGDYTKLYVLYYNITEWEQDDDYYYNGENQEHYIDTIDLSTKQIVASTRQPGNGRYALQGKPVKMLASEDGKYLSYVLRIRAWSDLQHSLPVRYGC